MINVIEDVKNEFKVKLTDKFEEEVISFLNTNGGNIYIGVNDKGNIIGINGNIDLLQRTIKDRIKDNIMPSTFASNSKLILFKYYRTLKEPIAYNSLIENKLLKNVPMSIVKVDSDLAKKIINNQSQN